MTHGELTKALIEEAEERAADTETRTALDPGFEGNMIADLLRRLAAALREREWRPIESAPKDGTAVLTYRPDRFGRHVTIAEWLGDDWYSCECCEYPTRWMPLPEPPK